MTVNTDPIIVTTTLDLPNVLLGGNQISLRRAIEIADARDGADTIVFSNAIASDATVEFSLGEITIDDDITIELGDITLVAGDDSIGAEEVGRHFDVIEGAELTLNGGVLSGGDVVFDGGSIRVADASLTTNDTVFLSNTASEFGFGGAISAVNSDLTIQGGRFEGNTGAIGGAISAQEGFLDVTDTVFEDNVGSDGAGALSVSTEREIPTINTVTSATFVDNESGSNGGAIGIIGQSLRIDDTVFEGNEATGSVSNGGAIFIDRDGRATITDSFFEANSAGQAGGAIENFRGGLSVDRSSFFNNTAELGGAISSNTSIELDFTHIFNSTFAQNTASVSGGALFTSGGVVLTSNTISENMAEFGGGIRSASSNDENVRLASNIIAGNISTDANVGNNLDWAESSPRSDIFALEGFNIIGDGTLADDVGIPVDLIEADATDRIGTDLMPLDPGLAALTVTDTGVFYDLEANSIARDTGSALEFSFSDQRGTGFLRVAGDQADVGAIEAQDANPTLTNAPATVSVREGTRSVLDLDAVDLFDDSDLEDEFETAFAFRGGDNDNNLFELDAETGVIRFIDAPDFEDPEDSDRNNAYLVQVRAVDGTDFVSEVQNITVNVTDTNESLVLSGLPDGLAVTQGQTRVVDLSDVVIANPEGDDVIVDVAIRADAGLTRALETDDVEVNASEDGQFVVLTGTIADITTYLDGENVFYTAPDAATTSDRLFVQIDEIGFVGDIGSVDVAIAAADGPVTINGGTSGFVSGGATADVIVTGDDETFVFAGSGDDVVAIVGDNSGASGDDGDDIIGALNGDHFIEGGAGADILVGGVGIDDIDGGSGNDVIKGDVSDFVGEGDVLSGGTGDDLIEGGVGADLFIFATNDGEDKIGTIDIDFANAAGSTVTGSDFESGVDQIVLDADFGFADADAAFASVTDVDGTAVFNAQGTTITFEGLSVADLSADDFILA